MPPDGAVSKPKIVRGVARRNAVPFAVGLAKRAASDPTASTYYAMLARCYRPSTSAYPYYGGRGISVCDAWRSSFATFLADMGARPPGMTLDRRDVNGNYEPANCRWSTHAEQSRNRRSTKLSVDDLTEIRAALARGERGTAIAARFGVVKQLISSIKRGHKWAA